MTLEDLHARIGETIGTSDWAAMDQNRINTFADATDDHQYIHVDPDRAKDGPFGQTIAHGFLTLAMLGGFLETGFPKTNAATMINYGFEKVRFLAPVKSGKRIRGLFKLADMLEKRPGQWQVNLEMTVEIEGEAKPAVIADWIIMLVA